MMIKTLPIYVSVSFLTCKAGRLLALFANITSARCEMSNLCPDEQQDIWHSRNRDPRTIK